jgi:uncharacterized protein YndB with AHSA1/START domain
MESKEKSVITVEVTINAPLEKVWRFWTIPEHIVKWNNASDDWHTTNAVNNLQKGGSFSYRMEAKDGSMGFDFGGTYNKILIHKHLDYMIDDGRNVRIDFSSLNNKTKIVETFETETSHSLEQQRDGWQSILDNFKKFAEKNK